MMTAAQRTHAAYTIREIDDTLLSFARDLDHGMAEISEQQFDSTLDSLIQRLHWLRMHKMRLVFMPVGEQEP